MQINDALKAQLTDLISSEHGKSASSIVETALSEFDAEKLFIEKVLWLSYAFSAMTDDDLEEYKDRLKKLGEGTLFDDSVDVSNLSCDC